MPDETAEPIPAVRAHAQTHVAVIQGGPHHGRVIRVQIDHDTVVLDIGGGKGGATYQRSTTERPDGVAFNYVPPAKPEPSIA